MVMESMYQSYNNPAIKISQGELRHILQRIETDFMESKIYLQSLTGLENSLGKSVANLSLTLGSLGREAIRLTFRELAKHCNIVATNTEEKEEKLVIQNSIPSHHYSRIENISLDSQPIKPMPITEEKGTQSPQSVYPIHLNSAPPDSINPPVSSINPSPLQSAHLPSLSTLSSSKPKRGKKLTKVELMAQLDQSREEGLKEIGLIIHQARIQKGWSIDYVRSLTLITLHQIIALETGDLKTLPEDVYLRGFIYRLAAVLHLDAPSLLQKLPHPDITKSTLPSWYQDSPSSSSYIRPIHLYLGYSTLVAGALGGLAVIMPQESRSLLPELPTIFTSPSPANLQQNNPTNKSKTSNSMQEAHRSIAPPEATF